MILADTSVWIVHFRAGNTQLADLLNQSLIMGHPIVVGELACGNLKHRAQILSDLRMLPSAVTATHDEVLRLAEDRKLWGLGIGWIDAHLLASALLPVDAGRKACSRRGRRRSDNLPPSRSPAKRDTVSSRR